MKKGLSYLIAGLILTGCATTYELPGVKLKERDWSLVFPTLTEKSDSTRKINYYTGLFGELVWVKYRGKPKSPLDSINGTNFFKRYEENILKLNERKEKEINSLQKEF